MTEEAAEASEAEESGFSPKEAAQFALRAVRENWLACVLIGVVVAAMGFTVVSALPRMYDATCKIFVQDSGVVTTSIASGGHHYNPGTPLRGLEEFILARDNLLSIAREAKLYDSWEASRPWPLRFKDKLMASLFGAPSRKDMERMFAGMLETAVSAAKDGESVRIHAQWRNAQSAYDIARLVQRNFLAARAANDLGPIRRAIPFLEEQQREADQAIEQAIERVQSATKSRGEPAAPPVPGKPPEAAAPGAGTASLELANISRQLADNRRQQRALMEPRRQKVTELKVELMDMSASYSADHPLMRQREARIASLSEVPPEVAELKEKESQLLSQLASRGVSRSTADTSAAAAARMPDPTDPELAPLQMRLGAALRKSDDLAARLEQAQIELLTAEADFKHRYVVVEEAEVPGAPFKPKGRPLLFLLAIVGGALIGAGAGVLLELRKGRLVDMWQVRALGLEVLGEVNLK